MNVKTLTVFILLFTAFSCTKKDTATPTIPAKSGFTINVKQNSKLSTGEVVAKDAPAFVQIWKADNKDFDLTKTFDLVSGYAYDKNTSTSFKYDYVVSNGQQMETPTGKYFAYVVLKDNGQIGRLARSATYFTVTEGSFIELTKTFTTHVTTGSFEEWDKAE